MRDGYLVVLERKEIYTRAHETRTQARNRRSPPSRASEGACLHAHGRAQACRCSGDSAICYCSAWTSILEAASTPQLLSWSLQILTTRRRNWRDIWNLGSFRDTHLLSRIGPTPERVGLNSFLVSSSLISCRIEHRDFRAARKTSLSWSYFAQYSFCISQWA